MLTRLKEGSHKGLVEKATPEMKAEVQLMLDDETVTDREIIEYILEFICLKEHIEE